jgi:hypothetical protein
MPAAAFRMQTLEAKKTTVQLNSQDAEDKDEKGKQHEKVEQHGKGGQECVGEVAQRLHGLHSAQGPEHADGTKGTHIQIGVKQLDDARNYDNYVKDIPRVSKVRRWTSEEEAKGYDLQHHF